MNFQVTADFTAHVKSFHFNTLIPHSSCGYLVVGCITTGDLNMTPCCKANGTDDLEPKLPKRNRWCAKRQENPESHLDA